MTHIEQMIKDMCPHGVEWKQLGEVSELKRGSSITANQAEEGDIPVIAGGQKPAYYHNQSNREGKNITVAGSGAYAGFVAFWEQPIFVSDAFTVTPKNDTLDIKFVYYYLTSLQEQIYHTKKGSGVPHVHPSSISDFEIPIPPLEIQKKIVECLDKFSALAAELQAELQMRRKQYEYYRTQLLTPHSDCNSADKTDDCKWEWKTLGEIAKYRRGSFPQPYGKQEWYDGEGAMPFVQVADVEEDSLSLKPTTKQFISRLAMPKSVFVPKGSVVVTLQGSIGKVAITQYDSYVDRTLGIFESFKIEINKRYFAYQLKRIFAIKREKARGGTIKTITKEEFTDFEIPIPSLKEQERIVNILDKFESLTNSLSDGIPAEQAAQQKRYEYYRDLLLTFDRKLP